MATVVWSNPAHEEKDRFYLNGVLQFGTTVANDTAQKIKEIEINLSRWPESGAPEPLLRGSFPIYRSKHINKRYKLIYWYDEAEDRVVIEDIWDTRRAPKNLVKRIK